MTRTSWWGKVMRLMLMRSSARLSTDGGRPKDLSLIHILILILPSDVADFRMRMFNSDGSESGMCGNGIRCVAKYCHDRGLTDRTEFTVESGGEIKLLRLTLAPDGTTQSVRVDMGAPQLLSLIHI